MKQLFKTARQRLTCRRGSSEIISFLVVVLAAVAMLSGIITYWGQMNRLDDIHQIAQSMAREISLTGRVDSDTRRRLSELETLLRLDVTMEVDGDFVSGEKLKTESDFTVAIAYQTTYGVGWINFAKEKTYVAKAVGTVEEYHKN